MTARHLLIASLTALPLFVACQSEEEDPIDNGTGPTTGPTTGTTTTTSTGGASTTGTTSTGGASTSGTGGTSSVGGAGGMSGVGGMSTGGMGVGGMNTGGGSTGSQVVFDLRDIALSYDEGLIEDLDEASTFTITLDGLSATLTASAGELNQTNSGFGVNHPDGGDATSQIDGDNAAEYVDIAFGDAVAFDWVDVSSFAGTDAASVDFPSSSVSVSMTGQTSTGAVMVPAGMTVRVAWVAGNGFSFDAFAATPVP